MLRHAAHSLLPAAAAAMRPAPLARVAAPAMMMQARCASGLVSKKMNFAISETGRIIDPYVRPDKVPKPFSAEGRSALFTYLKNLAQSTFEVSRLKRDIKFVATQFPLEAEELYKQMNKAFAEGRPNDVEPFVTNQMLSTLKNQMRKRPGTLSWEYLGAVERPKTVNLRYSKGQGDPFGVAQVTIKLHTKQRLTITDSSGKVLAATESDPVEYVVYERFTTANGKWRIAGKIDLAKQQQ
ncbi:39S ribosomal protein L45, mitochondrial [Blastocladiella emersonii ATCC 22665]|nr:39S ribosomal protein L45, mitochondrial [Blastocladiella emersonii ATCC 22665]